MAARRRTVGLVALAAALAATAVPSAEASITAPDDWPVNPAMQPSLDTWPNAVRLAGDTRYQTGLSAALTLRGTGGTTSYPFGSPDPTTASGSYGLGSCPRAVIVVAGDNPADALAASSLSDPTGQSTEPYLRITTSADQVFDPVGDFRRVDTDYAPILVTTSARQGATQLNLATRLAAQDLRNGACTTAREAIVVGGTSAVPQAVENELVSIGYSRIYRVAGNTRYATARVVAESLGTSGAPAGTTGCTDATADDGTTRLDFYANSVVEYRTDAQTCALLERTVVIADGTVGADALAAGWWTSYWQVPLLLHNGTDTLPAATAAALQTLSVDNVIVLGGTGRISDDVALNAAALATATLTRVSGTDRYATSVLMARRFGGWYTTGDAPDVAGSQLCIAASSGGTPTQPGLGWADALAAGPWCARSAAATRNAPVRALTPTNGAALQLTSTAQALTQPARDAVPVILVPADTTTLPTSIEDFVADAFPADGSWCTSSATTPGCSVPGFAVVFGGTSVVPDALVSSLSNLVSGETSTLDRTPLMTGVFVTRLDLSPVYATGGAAGSPRACVPRSGLTTSRWLVARTDTVSSLDVMTTGRYVTDADGTARTPASSAPVCVASVLGASGELSVWAAGLAGQRSTTTTFVPTSANSLSLDAPLTASTPTASSGIDSADNTSAGGSTTWTFDITPAASTLSVEGQARTVTSATVTIALTRGTDTPTVTGPDSFAATFSLTTDDGVISGTASGEAILDAGTWKLRGVTTFVAGWSGGGGWSIDIATVDPGLDDDTLSWSFDGVTSVSPAE
jgi:putative cell wall-binding protein